MDDNINLFMWSLSIVSTISKVILTSHLLPDFERESLPFKHFMESFPEDLPI